MKIHVITKFFIPVVAGIEINIFETYKRLARDGWDVTIHTSNDTYLKKNCLPEFETIDGLKIIRYRFGRFGFRPNIDPNERSLIALHNFDIFPHLQIMLAQFIRRISRKCHTVLFLTPHGGFNPEWRVFPIIVRMLKFIYTYTLGVTLINLSVDGVRAVSDWEKAELIKRGVRKSMVSTISNGLEDEAFKGELSQVTESTKILVKNFGRYIFDDARIYPIKDQATVIKALPLIPNDIKFVNIGMIGSQKYYDSLIDLARKLGVADRVIFPGIIRGEDKYYIYRNCTFFVHMAIWESFCNVVHQAISQGLVCIVSNNTALPYLVKDKINGYLVETKNHRRLADRINYLLNTDNRDEIVKIAKTNRIIGKENSWENVSEKMATRYTDLLCNICG